MAQKCHGNFNLFPAISIYSRQFQFYWQQFQFCSPRFQFNQGNFNFTHDNFNLFAAISTYSNFNLLTAISTYSRQFQFVHGNFNLLTAISICSRHFSLRSPLALVSAAAADSGHQKSKRKIKSRYLKSIFKVKSDNQKWKVDSRKLMPADIE